MDLSTPIREVSQTYKKYASRLEKLGIKTLEDFLYHAPSRYEDYSLISKIDKLQEGENVTVCGEVLEIKNQYANRFKKIQKCKIKDETGILDVIWFNQPYLTKYIKEGKRISLSGKVKSFGEKITLESPEYELITENNLEQNLDPHKTIHTGRLVPVYPETMGVSSKWLRRQVHNIISNQGKTLLDHIPCSIIENNDFMDLSTSLEQLHFPKNMEKANKARKRLAFDELFLLQLSARERRRNWQKKFVGNKFSVSKFKKNIDSFLKILPFELTNSQKKSVEEIFYDLSSEKPMNRLLEGDVGSGKTVVSAIAMYLAFLNGFQSLLMAPTEILAQQHYKTISNLLSPLNVKVELVTGSKKIESGIKNQESRAKKHHSSFLPAGPLRPHRREACREASRQGIIHNSNDFNVLVGTHALLNEKIKVEKLGLVVIDEQQRFGVEQRAIVKKKGKNPHLLVMTATPIPRTIALTMYGDLDLSYLDQMPLGRKKIKTWLVGQEKRISAYEWIKSEIKNFKSQAFIICPLIEESENMKTIKAATVEFERLKKEVFPDLKLGLLHGKLKSNEKDLILSDFKEKKIDILVATPVVEVGIDIPNASVIVIEAAERFGLSQLHQLRGRVGRGDMQSYCLLFSQEKNPKTYQRLKAMETMQNGAELAELDLKLRGPGEMYGIKQHGLPILKIASFSDFSLIEKTKIEAEKISENLENYPLLKEKIKKINIKEVSPD